MDRPMESDRTACSDRVDRIFAGDVVVQAGPQGAMTMSDDLQDSLAYQTPTGGSPTLDDLFRRTAARQPDAVALIDPSNKHRVTGRQPLRLTFAEADHAISWIATSFIEAGLPQGSIVAVQL